MRSPRGMRPTAATAPRRSQSVPQAMSYASHSPRSPRSSQYGDDDTANSGGWLGMVKDTLFGDDEYSEDGSEYSDVEESTADPSLGPYYNFGGAPATLEPKGTETKNIYKPRSSNTWAPAPVISPPQSPLVRKAESTGFKLHNRQLTFPNRKAFPRLVAPAATNTKIASQHLVREKRAEPKKIDIKMKKIVEPKKNDKFSITEISSPHISIKSRADSQVEKAIITNKYAPPRSMPGPRNISPDSPEVGVIVTHIKSSTPLGLHPSQNQHLSLKSRRPSRIPTTLFKRTPHSDITWDVTTASGDVSMSAATTEASSIKYLSPYFKPNNSSAGLQKKPEPLKVKRSSTYTPQRSSEKKQIYRPPGFPKERWSPLKKYEDKDSGVESPPKPSKAQTKIPAYSSKRKQLEEENEIVFNDASSDIENEPEDRLWNNHQLWDGLSYKMIANPSLDAEDDRVVERWTGDAKPMPTSRSDMHEDSSVGKSLQRERNSLKSYYVSQLSVDLAHAEDPAIKTDPPATMARLSPLSTRVRSSPTTPDRAESPAFLGAPEKKIAFGWTVKSPISRVSECTRETASTGGEKSVVSWRSKFDNAPKNVLNDLLHDCGPQKEMSLISTSHAAQKKSDDFLRFDEDKLKAIIAEDDISKNTPGRDRSTRQSNLGGESAAPLPVRDSKPVFGSASRLLAKRTARKKKESKKDKEPYDMMAAVRYGVNLNGTLKSQVLKRSNRSEPNPIRPFMNRVTLEIDPADQGAGCFDIARVSPAVGREMEPENENTAEIGVESVLRNYQDNDGAPAGPDFLILDPLVSLRPEGDDGGKERKMIISPFKLFRNAAERHRDPVKVPHGSSSPMELGAADEARKQKFVNPFPRILESPLPTTKQGENSPAGRRPPIRRVEVEDTASCFHNEGIEVNRVSTPSSESKASSTKPTPLGAFRRLKNAGSNPTFIPRPQRKPLLAVETIRNDQEEFSHQGFEVEPSTPPRTLELDSDKKRRGKKASTPAGTVQLQGADSRFKIRKARSYHHPSRKSPAQTPPSEMKTDANYSIRMESPVDRRKLNREAHLAKLVAEAAANCTEKKNLNCVPPSPLEIPTLDEKAQMATQIVFHRPSKEDKHCSPQASIVMHGCFENQCKIETQGLEQSLPLLDFKPWHDGLLQSSSAFIPQLEAKNSTATAEDIIEDLDAASERKVHKSRSSTPAKKDDKSLSKASSKDIASRSSTPAKKDDKSLSRASSKDIAQNSNDEADRKANTKESEDNTVRMDADRAQEQSTQMISNEKETDAKDIKKQPSMMLAVNDSTLQKDDSHSTETPKLTIKKKLKNLFRRKKKTTFDGHPVDFSYHHLLAESSAESTTDEKSLRTKVTSATAIASPIAAIQRKDTEDKSSDAATNKLSKASSSVKPDSQKQDENTGSVANISHVEKKLEIVTNTEVMKSPATSKEAKKNTSHRNLIPKRLPRNKKYSSQSCASSVDNSLDKLMEEDDDDELCTKDTISTVLSSSTNPSYTRVKLGDNTMDSSSRSKESSRLDKAENKVAKRLARDLRLLARIERRRRELARKPQAQSYADSIEVLDTLEKLVKRRAMIVVEEEGVSVLEDHHISGTNDGWFGNLSHKVADMFACAAPPPCRPS